MFIINESTASVTEFNGYVPEITDYSDDSVNIMEASMFFDEGVSKIVRATAMAEVAAYNEGSIEAFEEGVGHTVWEKIKKLWEKFKAFLVRLRDRFMAWVRKTFTSNGAFLKKYSKVIKENIGKLDLKNPSFSIPDFNDAQTKFDAIAKFVTEHIAMPASDDNTKAKVDEKLNPLKDSLKEAEEDFNKTIDDTSDVKYKDIPADIKNVLTEPSTIEKSLNTEFDIIKKRVTEQEKELTKINKDATATAVMVANTQFKKDVLTAMQSATIKLNKAKLRVVTKIAYAAVKLQHTNRDDIKEESTSLSILDKYLERI